MCGCVVLHFRATIHFNALLSQSVNFDFRPLFCFTEDTFHRFAGCLPLHNPLHSDARNTHKVDCSLCCPTSSVHTSLPIEHNGALLGTKCQIVKSPNAQRMPSLSPPLDRKLWRCCVGRSKYDTFGNGWCSKVVDEKRSSTVETECCSSFGTSLFF
ncbi:hypothetical protein NPIL_500191 [Nephila pilipes]|uniref:Uncharacterized protein n=1 Tax=Nephila pilipes TaxID=299642 RepID=A0A8X6PKH3_NEPPI|nr:hypothetical protein NPIL_500191 [Nephila pilipes]